MTEIDHASRIALFKGIEPEVSEAFDRHISKSGRNTILYIKTSSLPL